MYAIRSYYAEESLLTRIEGQVADQLAIAMQREGGRRHDAGQVRQTPGLRIHLRLIQPVPHHRLVLRQCREGRHVMGQLVQTVEKQLQAGRVPAGLGDREQLPLLQQPYPDIVITSYSIHYTKLYDCSSENDITAWSVSSSV